MIPLNLDQILKHLRRKNYDAKLQSETNQIYFIHKAGQLEFPIFFRIFEKGDLLQLLAFIPSNFKEGTQTEVARLLHLLNKELDIPGFGMDETEGVIFYRSMLPAFDKKIDLNLLESFLKAIPVICETFAPVIIAVANKKASFKDVLRKVSDSVSKDT